jgi:hypothetical protein
VNRSSALWTRQAVPGGTRLAISRMRVSPHVLGAQIGPFLGCVGLNNLGPGVSVGFGMIIRVLFSALYAVFRVLLALMVTRGRCGLGRMSSCWCCGMRLRCCVGR